MVTTALRSAKFDAMNFVGCRPSMVLARRSLMAPYAVFIVSFAIVREAAALQIPQCFRRFTQGLVIEADDIAQRLPIVGVECHGCFELHRSSLAHDVAITGG